MIKKNDPDIVFFTPYIGGAMKLLLTLFSTVVCLTLAHAEDQKESPIVGAFGLKLGEKFDTKKAAWKQIVDGGFVFYGFTPSNPLKGFTHYYVNITPEDSLIYRIGAIQKFDSPFDASSEYDVVCHLLKQKYGVFEKQKLKDSLDRINRIKQGDRWIEVDLDEGQDPGIFLVYIDTHLMHEAEKQKILNKAAKTDASGL